MCVCLHRDTIFLGWTSYLLLAFNFYNEEEGFEHAGKIAAMRLLFLAALAGLFAAELGSANIGRGVPGHIASRQTDGDHNLVENRRDFSQTREQTHHKRAASPKATTQAEWAKINNTVDECTSYNLPAMSSLGKSYPTVWEVADILPDDTQALSIMKAINASGVIPSSDLPHGTAPGSYSGTGIQHGYDSNSDPDCYWTSTACTKPKHPGILPDITTCDEPHTYGYTFDDVSLASILGTRQRFSHDSKRLTRIFFLLCAGPKLHAQCSL